MINIDVTLSAYKGTDGGKKGRRWSCLLLVSGEQNQTFKMDRMVDAVIVGLFYHSIQFYSIQFNSFQFYSVQFSSINSIQFSSVQFNSVQFNSSQFN